MFRERLSQHAEICLKIYDAFEKQNLQPVIRLDAVSNSVCRDKPKTSFDLFCLNSYSRFEIKTSKVDRCLLKNIVSTNFYIFCFLKSNRVMIAYGKCLKNLKLEKENTGYEVCYVVTPETPYLVLVGSCKPFKIDKKLDYHFLREVKKCGLNQE